MNARMFSQHDIRKEIQISPIWEFRTIDKEESVYNMIVPACWESNPLLSSYKGQAIYSKIIEFGGNVRFVFKGVSHTAYIYVDGKQVAYHYNAYTQFDVVLKGMDYGEHKVEVRVLNTFHEESALHVVNDYYSYGGITRPVILEQLLNVYVRNLKFKPFFKDGQWHGRVSANIENVTCEEKIIDVNIKLGKNDFVIKQIVVAGNEKVNIEGTYIFEDVKPYRLNDPKLYFIHMQISENERIIDDLIDRVGFREIEVRGDNILFNNEQIIIKGVNRHEDYAEFGCAVPVEGMYRDIELIKSLGANCVRTCHYPNDERFLDMCDENGIIVWEEAHARGLNEEQMKHKNFDEQSANCISEMIENHYNHPSIFVWGVLNECVSNTEFGKSIYAKQIKQIKMLDDSRPVTYASLQAFIGNDLSLDLVDIVSYNIYPKWYENDSTKELVGELKNFVGNSGGKGKPILISEIGAGAIYGYRSNNCEKWTEDYQEVLINEQLTTILEDKDLSGVIVWQFADCRVEPGWFGVRPKSQNNKGLVDMYRREKLAYRTVQQIFKKK